MLGEHNVRIGEMNVTGTATDCVAGLVRGRRDTLNGVSGARVKRGEAKGDGAKGEAASWNFPG